MKEEGADASTTVTDLSIVDGLDGLQKCTLAAMQSEIDALKEELKKQNKVGGQIYIFCINLYSLLTLLANVLTG